MAYLYLLHHGKKYSVHEGTFPSLLPLLSRYAAFSRSISMLYPDHINNQASSLSMIYANIM